MRWGYVLPDPSTYGAWSEFEGDVACIRDAGYDAVELQVIDPAGFDGDRVLGVLERAGLPLLAVQTGQTYALRGNCLSTADAAVRRRTTDLLKSFVPLAACTGALLVFGSLQGRLADEPDRAAASRRICDAVVEVGEAATAAGVTLAFEPVQHGEVGFHTTIADVAAVVRAMGLGGVRMMVDTFHMNIEERDMIAPLEPIRDLLAHVHLCETNRGVLGEGHWPTGSFVRELERIGYAGDLSIGVYNTRRPRRDCIAECLVAARAACTTGDRA